MLKFLKSNETPKTFRCGWVVRIRSEVEVNAKGLSRCNLIHSIWLSEKTSYVHDVAEAALAHTIGDKVVAAYQRGDLFEKRRQLMLGWADFVNGYK